MSAANVRAALESALNGMSPALSTAWENVKFTPVNGTPYQRATIMLADPGNQEYGAGYQELGIFQIDLYYPVATGPAASIARAELIRSTFPRGAAFTSGGESTTIQRTPSIYPAYVDGNFYVTPVKIRFFSNNY